MTLGEYLFTAALLLFGSALCTASCQSPARAAAPCPEGSHERRFECAESGRLVGNCFSLAERWYVCQKGEWVQE